MFSRGHHVQLSPLVRKAALAAMAVAALAGAPRTLATIGGGPDWRMIGKDSKNSRNQPHDHKMGVRNVSNLVVKWRAATGMCQSKSRLNSSGNVLIATSRFNLRSRAR
jgi:hypothetical protein